MTPSPLFNRQLLLQKLQRQAAWDVLVIGGGATGLGIAVDAASRGYSTLLLEQADFAKGTSSRSTKLVHGGVRYLAQGNIPLVYSALRERGILLQNAPHLVAKRAFVIPCFSWGAKLKYLIGLKFYDALSGRWSFGKSKLLTKKEVTEQLPGIEEQGLKGGVLYYDGQFDDARLAINLAQTAIEAGAVALNYMKVTGLLKTAGKITGVIAQEQEQKRTYELKAKAIINATGVFADAVYQMDGESKTLLKQSQGVHIVIDQEMFPAGSALMIPETRDGRVLFAIPWRHYVVVGTTDTPVSGSTLEPHALDAEVDFILDTLNGFAKKPLSRKDIRSVFAGLRPLVLPQKEVVSTKELSRDHKIIKSESNLITIIGGKWTTYRKMAEETVDLAVKTGLLSPKKCSTKTAHIHGFTNEKFSHSLSQYGADAMGILKSWDAEPHLKKQLHKKFEATEAEVLWAVHHEMARTVEDVLARRLRFLFLDARAAIEAAPRVAQIMRKALMQDSTWEQEQVAHFKALAKKYIATPDHTETVTQKPLPTN
jgi:glycerol-3-phosphate dehydrogenase